MLTKKRPASRKPKVIPTIVHDFPLLVTMDGVQYYLKSMTKRVVIPAVAPKPVGVFAVGIYIGNFNPAIVPVLEQDYSMEFPVGTKIIPLSYTYQLYNEEGQFPLKESTYYFYQITNTDGQMDFPNSTKAQTKVQYSLVNFNSQCWVFSPYSDLKVLKTDFLELQQDQRIFWAFSPANALTPYYVAPTNFLNVNNPSAGNTLDIAQVFLYLELAN
jgi:hypothetical protein